MSLPGKGGTSSVRIQWCGESVGCALWLASIAPVYALVCCSSAYALHMLLGGGLQVKAVRSVNDPGGTSSTPIEVYDPGGERGGVVAPLLQHTR